MICDFTNAATRHYKDAEFLYKKRKLPNADQLYGLAAECVLKSIIVGLCPADVDVNGDFTNRTHRKHLGNGSKSDINGLWNYFSDSFCFSGRLAAHLSLPTTNSFSDWDVSQRYHHDRCFTSHNVEQHRVGVKELRKFRDNVKTSMGI